MLLFWLGLWLNTAAAAQTTPTCVKKTSKTSYQEPADLKALLKCQRRKMVRAAADYEAQNGDAPSDATLEGWQELQRREVRDFIRRHPDRSVLKGPAASPAQAAETEPAQDGAAKSSDQDLQALEKDLWGKSDQGRKGITPEMAQEIVNTLMKQQGSVSPDMAGLLDAVQKDGANLSGDTVRRLQEAARKADAAGLDLGVPVNVRKTLLEGELEKGQTAPAAPGVD
jgi:hypothetical protein